MENIPFYVRHHVLTAGNRETLTVRPQQPMLSQLINAIRDQHAHYLQRIVSRARVLIVEGISGSGKDTFQAYLKTKLKNRDVYEYSEGDVLTSWKQLQIDGVFDLRIKYMKLFANYVKDVVTREENSVFLLNRFHLSAYAQQPQVGPEYDDIISTLKTLPVHIFILRVDESEIEKRSVHPERSGAWRKFQKQVGDSFRGRLERQQKTIIELAKQQQIPYSLVKLIYESETRTRDVDISKASSLIDGGASMNAAGERLSRRRRGIPPAAKETV